MALMSSWKIPHSRDRVKQKTTLQNALVVCLRRVTPHMVLCHTLCRNMREVAPRPQITPALLQKVVSFISVMVTAILTAPHAYAA